MKASEGPNQRDWEDIGYSALVTELKQYHVSFALYEISGRLANGRLLWVRKGALSHPDTVKSIDEAELYAHGDVKWDGCSNWYVDEQDRLMLHQCTRSGLLTLGQAMARCWDWAGELMDDTWRGER